MKNNDNKKNRKYKQAVLRENLLNQPDIVSCVERAVTGLIDEDKPVTIKAVAERTGLATSDVRLVLPVFTDRKASRIELRCTWEQKHRWEHKARQANRTVSQLAAASLTSLTIHVPRSEQLRAEINQLVVERTRFNSLVNQLAKWCNTYRASVDQLHVLAMLSQLQDEFTAHDRRVMAAINKKHVFDGLGTRVLTDGVEEWEAD